MLAKSKPQTLTDGLTPMRIDFRRYECHKVRRVHVKFEVDLSELELGKMVIDSYEWMKFTLLHVEHLSFLSSQEC